MHPDLWGPARVKVSMSESKLAWDTTRNRGMRVLRAYAGSHVRGVCSPLVLWVVTDEAFFDTL